MLKETSGGDDILIYCVNHACASNGGDNFSAIQSDATATLQSQVDRLRGELVAARGCVSGWMKENATGGWIANLRLERDQLSTALEKCVAALESLRDHQNGCPLPSYEEGWTQAMRETDDALSTAKPLLNKP